MPTMIETSSLRFAYPADEGGQPVFALRGVDLKIEKGSFVVVLGHNGSGKSTLAKTFNAVLLPAGGKVYVEGMDTLDEKLLLAIRQRVGASARPEGFSFPRSQATRPLAASTWHTLAPALAQATVAPPV